MSSLRIISARARSVAGDFLPFRGVDYQFMRGGQRVAHPGDVID